MTSDQKIDNQEIESLKKEIASLKSQWPKFQDAAPRGCELSKATGARAYRMAERYWIWWNSEQEVTYHPPGMGFGWVTRPMKEDGNG